MTSQVEHLLICLIVKQIFSYVNSCSSPLPFGLSPTYFLGDFLMYAGYNFLPLNAWQISIFLPLNTWQIFQSVACFFILYMLSFVYRTFQFNIVLCVSLS